MTKLKLHGYPTLYNFFDGEIPSSEKITIDWRGVKRSTIQSKVETSPYRAWLRLLLLRINAL